jgi:hypothetical protein
MGIPDDVRASREIARCLSAHDLMPGLSALAADVFDVCWNGVLLTEEFDNNPRSEWRSESVMAVRPAESANGCLLWCYQSNRQDDDDDGGSSTRRLRYATQPGFSCTLPLAPMPSSMAGLQ